MLHIEGIKIDNIHNNIVDLESSELRFHNTINVNHLYQSKNNPLLKEILNHKVSYNSIDGKWVIFALIRKYSLRNIIKNSGSDLIFRLIDNYKFEGQGFFFLGGSPKNNLEALLRAKKQNPNCKVHGYSPPYFNINSSDFDEINQEIFKILESTKIKNIIVGLGVPKQEYWAYKNLNKLKSMGIKNVYFFGGAIDFYSGNLSRAPKIIQDSGLESIYRLIKNPSRFRLFLKWLYIIPKIIFNYRL